MRLVGGVPKVSLAAEEGGASQWNVTLTDSCQVCTGTVRLLRMPT